MKYTKKLVDNLKYHVVDSTAMLVSAQPVFTAFEKMVAGMSDDVSINIRIYGTALTYFGLGYVIGKTRDFSKKLFKITDKTKERTQQIHDSAYLAAINLPLGVGLYTIAGETDIKKIIIGTGMSVAFGAFLGPWTGYAIDSYRDLTGLKKCKRRAYPEVIRNLKPKVKKGFAAALTAASIGLIVAIYSVTPSDNQDINHNSQTQQQIIDNQRSNSGDLETIIIDENN